MGYKVKYFNVLHDAKLKVKCDYCELRLLPSLYLSHLTDGHQDKMERHPTRACIWCMSYSRKAVDQYAHRLPCMEHRILKDEVPMRQQKLARVNGKLEERGKIIEEKDCEMKKQWEEILGLRQALKEANAKLEEMSQITKQKDREIREQGGQIFRMTDTIWTAKWQKNPFNTYM